MKNWYEEEWEFDLVVLGVGETDRPEECRMGFEVGDVFTARYDCPGGFCSKTIMKVYPICEAVRSGGDLRNLGGESPTAMVFVCPDGVVRFRLQAQKLVAGGCDT